MLHMRAIQVAFNNNAPKGKKFDVDQCVDGKCEHKSFGKPEQVMRYLLSRPSRKLTLPQRLRQDYPKTKTKTLSSRKAKKHHSTRKVKKTKRV
jgi:hypothetical protein